MPEEQSKVHGRKLQQVKDALDSLRTDAQRSEGTRQRDEQINRDMFKDLVNKVKDVDDIKTIVESLLDVEKAETVSDKKRDEYLIRKDKSEKEDTKEFRRSFLKALSAFGAVASEITKTNKSLIKTLPEFLAPLMAIPIAATAGGAVAAAPYGNAVSWKNFFKHKFPGIFGPEGVFGRLGSFISKLKYETSFWFVVQGDRMSRLWGGIKNFFSTTKGPWYTRIIGQVMKLPILKEIGMALNSVTRIASSFIAGSARLTTVFMKLPVIAQTLGLVWGGVEGVMAAWDDIKKGNYSDAVFKGFSQFWEVFTFGILEKDIMVPWFQKIRDDLGQTFGHMLNMDFKNSARGLVGTINNVVTGAAETVLDSVADWGSDIWEWFGGDASTVRKHIATDWVRRAETAIDGIFVAIGLGTHEIAQSFNQNLGAVLNEAMMLSRDSSGYEQVTASDWGPGEDSFAAFDTKQKTPYPHRPGASAEAGPWVHRITDGVQSGDMFIQRFKDSQGRQMIGASGYEHLPMGWEYLQLPDGTIQALQKHPRGPTHKSVKDQFGDIKGLAFGGIVKGLGDGIGGLFRLGERGKEMVAPIKDLPNLLGPMIDKAVKGGGDIVSQLPQIIDPIMSRGMSMAQGFMENDQIKDLTASMPGMLDKLAGMVPTNIAIGGHSISNNSSTTAMSSSFISPRNPDISRQIDMNC